MMVINVIRFNWPFYLVAILAIAVGVAVGSMAQLPEIIRSAALLGSAFALWFLLISIAATYLAYDHSDLYQLKQWPTATSLPEAERIACIHAGFDSISDKLKNRFPSAQVVNGDLFDSEVRATPSLSRARRIFGDSSELVDLSSAPWPLPYGSFEVILMANSLHEMRTSEKLGQALAESARTLREEGELIVIEHTRDVSNFLVYGVGALHFYSAFHWQKHFAAAGFREKATFKISRWMTCWVLEKVEEATSKPATRGG